MFEPDPTFEEWLKAAERGDSALVLDHLHRGMNVNAGRHRTNTTALMMAVRGCQIEMIQLLVDHGADLDPENSYGFTALTYAVIASRPGGDHWSKPIPDPRPLELLLSMGGRHRLLEAVLLNDVGLARARLDEGADVNTGEWTYYGPVLKFAAELGYLGIMDLLLSRGADIEATDDVGQRPLLSAAYRGQTEAARLLLDRGAEINAVDWTGGSALANAAIQDHEGTFDLLLARGAHRGIVDALARNEMPLFEALLDEKLRTGAEVDSRSDGPFRLAVLAARRGNLAALQLLLDRGAAQLHPWDRRSLLAEAAKHGHGAVVQWLIGRGADLHAVGRDGLTPLAWAIKNGQNETASLLKLAGADH